MLLLGEPVALQAAFPARQNGPIAARLGQSVYFIEPDGSARRPVPALTGAADLAWSRDGSRLAFTRARRNNVVDLYVAGQDGTDARLLVRNAEAPSWSPDGQQLVFMRFVCPEGSCPELENPYELFTVAVGGGPVRRLTRNGGYDGEPDWSPDGTAILFATDDGLFLIGPDGRNRRRLTRGAHSNPDWAPGGARIAYDTFSDVYVMRISGRIATRLTKNLGPDLAPAWSPDGRRIAYLSNSVCARGGGGCTAHDPLLIRTTPVAGGRPTPITGLGWGPPQWLPRLP